MKDQQVLDSIVTAEFSPDALRCAKELLDNNEPERVTLVARVVARTVETADGLRLKCGFREVQLDLPLDLPIAHRPCD